MENIFKEESVVNKVSILNGDFRKSATNSIQYVIINKNYNIYLRLFFENSKNRQIYDEKEISIIFSRFNVTNVYANKDLEDKYSSKYELINCECIWDKTNNLIAINKCQNMYF